jgi:hypothetical protein
MIINRSVEFRKKKYSGGCSIEIFGDSIFGKDIIMCRAPIIRTYLGCTENDIWNTNLTVGWKVVKMIGLDGLQITYSVAKTEVSYKTNRWRKIICSKNI